MPHRGSCSAILALVCGLALGTATASEAADPPARFAVAVTGKGPDVILIPGLATPGEVWDATVAHLAPGHRLHVVQIAGFGGTDGGPNRGDDEMLPPIVKAIAMYAGRLDRPAIVGHSLGGLIALDVAAQAPDAISRVMVVDALPFYALTMSPEATVDMVRPAAGAMRDQLMAQTDAQYALSAPLTAARLVKSATGRASVSKWAAASDRAVVARAMYEDILTDARPRLARIKASVTVLYAFDAARGFPQDATDALYSSAFSGLPGVDLRRVDGSYHFIMLDQPERFLSEVETFLK